MTFFIHISVKQSTMTSLTAPKSAKKDGDELMGS